MIPADAVVRTGLRDRSKWNHGPWDQEPQDRIAWKSQGFDCLMLRNNFGAWCGYVAMTPDHPWFRKDYGDDALNDVSVHGGLTFADHCHGTEGEGICHTPGPGEPDTVWWLGFDTAHSGDVYPERLGGADYAPSSWGESYKGIGYVQRQVEHLAEQAAAARLAT